MTIGRAATMVHIVATVVSASMLLGWPGAWLAVSYLAWRVMEHNP